jgi:DNA-binding MarR family transcriptional regulator
MPLDDSIARNETSSTLRNDPHAEPQSRGIPLPRKDRQFVRLDFEVIDRYLSTLKGSALSVYVALARHDNDDHDCHPGVRKLAAETGYKPRQVQLSLRKLEALGLVRSIPRTDDWGDPDTNRYILLVPPPGQSIARRERHAPAGVVPDRHGVVPDRHGVVHSTAGGVVHSTAPGVVHSTAPKPDPLQPDPREPDLPVCVSLPQRGTHTHNEWGQGKASKGGEMGDAEAGDSEDGETCPECGRGGIWWDVARQYCAGCEADQVQRLLDAKRPRRGYSSISR